MAAWYNGIGVMALPGVGGGKASITDLRQIWNAIATSQAVALTVTTAHGLYGNTTQTTTEPPACNPVALNAWKVGLGDLAKAAQIEMTVRTIGPPQSNAAQYAKAGFTQLDIVTQQGQLATTAAG